jgi:hypothetical protein
MHVMLAAAIAPWWAVLPTAVVAMLVVAGHVMLLPGAAMPASRRRIRAANGLLMLVTLPLAAYAVGAADPDVDPRRFVLAWMLTAGLLVIILGLAMLDILNTLRLRSRERREAIDDLARARAEALAGAVRDHA